MMSEGKGKTFEDWVARTWKIDDCATCCKKIDNPRHVWVLDVDREQAHELYHYPDDGYRCANVQDELRRVAKHLSSTGYCFCSEKCALLDIGSTKDHCDWCHGQMDYGGSPYMISDDMLCVVSYTVEDFKEVSNTLTFCSLHCAESYQNHR